MNYPSICVCSQECVLSVYVTGSLSILGIMLLLFIVFYKQQPNLSRKKRTIINQKIYLKDSMEIPSTRKSLKDICCHVTALVKKQIDLSRLS